MGPTKSTRFHYGYHTENNEFTTTGGLLQYLSENKEESCSYQDAAPVSDSSFPVILYSHGYGGAVEENEPLYERLVENGYIVVSIGHTHELGMTTLDKGKVIYISDEMAEDAEERVIAEEDLNLGLKYGSAEIERLFELPLGEEPTEELLQGYHHHSSEFFTGFQDHLDLWVEDTKFVLSELERINRGQSHERLAGIFDLSRIGATGWSFGGATARRFCGEEPRCMASINMDGSSFARQDEELSSPHLEMTADLKGTLAGLVRDGVPEDAIPKINDSFERSRHNAGYATIAAAKSDLFLFSLETSSHGDFAAGWLDLHEEGAGSQVRHEIVESTSVYFFDTYLKGDLDPSSQSSLCDVIYEDENIIPRFDNACP